MSREIIEQELIAAERRAADGRFQIGCHVETIKELTRLQRDTAAAQATLATLNEDQAVHNQEVKRLLAELRKAQPACAHILANTGNITVFSNCAAQRGKEQGN